MSSFALVNAARTLIGVLCGALGACSESVDTEVQSDKAQANVAAGSDYVVKA